jgi:hypothetical protein
MTIRREIIWSADNATDAEVRAKEIEDIKTLRSSDPVIGYNRTPTFSPQAN